MNRFSECFSKGESILSIYLTAGFPRIDDTLAVAKAAVDAGARMLEIGFPFSDPIADGPVIQASNQRAIANGMTLRRLLEELPALRRVVDVPLVLMGALNPILRLGEEQFFRTAGRAGADGVIIPDLPFSEFRRYEPISRESGVALVPLVTTRTTEERLRAIDSQTRAFIYLVSSDGTTGGKLEVDEARAAAFSRIARLGLSNPVMVGFGISDRSSFERATVGFAGGIVGSAFVRALADTPDPVRAARELVGRLAGKGEKR